MSRHFFCRSGEKNYCFFKLFSFLILIISQHLNAETNPDNNDYFQLETVVVTGTRSERRLADAPVRSEVISKEQINQQHARNVAEALRYVPGLLLKPIIGKNGVEVWLQGVNGDRVLVLIDGKPITASTGSTVDLTQIAVTDLERIEVVKGASSVLYGSNAIGGVINLITSKAAAGFSGQLSADVGSLRDGNAEVIDETALSTTFAYRQEKVEARLNGSFRQGEGYDLDESTYFDDGEAFVRYNLDGYVGYQIRDAIEIYFQPSFYHEDKHYPFSTFAPGVGDIQKEYQGIANRQRYLLGTRYQHGSQTGNLYGFYEIFDDETRQDVLVTPEMDFQRKARIRLAQVEGDYNLLLGERHFLTFGFKWLEEGLDQEQIEQQGDVISIDQEVADAKRQALEFFVQDDFFITERLELLFGFRQQYDSDFGAFLAPKISLLYRQAEPNVRWRFSVGSGYRVPNLKERFYFFDHSNLGYILIGNPDLEPEKSLSIQLGAEWLLRKNLIADINFYYNAIDDLISSDLDPAESARRNLQVFRYLNIGRARTQGVELVVNWQIHRFYRLSGNYTYLEAKDRDTGNFLTRRPQQQFKLGIHAFIPRWNSNLDAYLVAQSKEYIDSDNQQTSPGWTQLDLKLNRNFSTGLTGFVGVDNVFDRVADSNDLNDLSPTRGRFIYTGLRYRF